MITLNHIAIATSKLPQLTRVLEVLGLSVDHSEEVKSQGVMTHFIPLSGSPGSLELLEPLDLDDPKGVIAQFIKKRGAGIHHLAFGLDAGELDPLCERLKKEGIRLVYDRPQPGAHGMKVQFIHPASCDGVLIEILEKASHP